MLIFPTAKLNINHSFYGQGLAAVQLWPPASSVDRCYCCLSLNDLLVRAHNYTFVPQLECTDCVQIEKVNIMNDFFKSVKYSNAPIQFWWLLY